LKFIVFYYLFFNTLYANVSYFQEINRPDVGMFLLFVFATLGITYWAAKRTKTAKDFYLSGGGVTGLQNSLAISGDYMSAASFLGISGLVYLNGFDGLIYSVGFIVGWPIILLLMAEQLRNLGRYTFVDVVSYRLKKVPIRILASCSSILIVLLYLVAQMIGSGKLIEILFGIPYELSVVIVGMLIVILVTFGGMLATTWVQIVKAIFLLSGATFLAFMIMYRVDFSIDTLFERAVEVRNSADIMSSGNLIKDPISAISLGIALMFGAAGLPHILMRFFTVYNAKEARKSIFYATGFIGYFYILTFIIGFGAIVFVSGNSQYFDPSSGNILGGPNMVAMHLSHIIGGDLFFGFICAVAFATILAVVSALTLAGASAISNDLYVNVFKKGRVDEVKERMISKISIVILGVLSIILGITFEEQNIAFMVSLAFGVAASTNFPVLFLSIYWKNLTTRGAVIGGTMGLISVTLLIILSPVVWGEIINKDTSKAIFPYEYPALFSVSIAFLGIWFFSITDKSKDAILEKKMFEKQWIKSQIGTIN